MKTKETYVETLKDNVCKIVFEKLDTTKRTMYCTLREDVLPAMPEGTAPHEIKTKNLVVFDLEKDSWRSIRPESIETFEVYNSFDLALRGVANV